MSVYKAGTSACHVSATVTIDVPLTNHVNIDLFLKFDTQNASSVVLLLGPNLQNFVKWTFAILSYLFRMSANKLSSKKFTKERRNN